MCVCMYVCVSLCVCVCVCSDRGKEEKTHRNGEKEATKNVRSKQAQ